MKKVIVLMGVAGSGKTYLGKKISDEIKIFTFIDSDNYHTNESKKRMSLGMSISETQRIKWLIKTCKIINQTNNNYIILACSALKAKHRSLLKQRYAFLQFIFLKYSFEVVSMRLKNRKNHFFNPILLKKQYKLLEDPKNTLKISPSWPEKQVISFILKLIYRIYHRFK